MAETAEAPPSLDKLSLNESVEASTEAPSPAPAPSPSPSQQPPVGARNGAPPPLHHAATSPPPQTGGPPRPPQGPAGMRGRPMGMGARGGMMNRGGAPQQSRLPPSLQAKMDKLAASRPSSSHTPTLSSQGAQNPDPTSMSALLRSHAAAAQSGGTAGPAQNVPGPASGPLGLAARRAGPRPNLGSLNAGGATAPPNGLPGMGRKRMGPGLTLSGMKGGDEAATTGAAGGDSKFSSFGKIVDPSGSLKFSSKAVLHAKGVDFSNGQSFSINMDEMQIIEELGKGNYGTVQKCLHKPTNVVMAMKEIRLELDDSKLAQIIMELDILHRAVAPEIVEFYGAFTIESCVYYCMEFMDAGSLDTLTGGGVPASDIAQEEQEEVRVPEDVLRRITASMVRGLGFLKDELQVMHRDVKPTNVLINKKGEIKLCDFGVSGQLEKSLAKTNIGCQSYMAPERIKGESQNQVATYTVSSDVWSVGLSIIELARGCYPYPPETFANVFAQLQAIVYGPPPTLPKGYSADAHDFVAQCLRKDPNTRPTYAQLLKHPFLLPDKEADVDMVGWVASALEKRAARPVIPLKEVEA